MLVSCFSSANACFMSSGSNTSFTCILVLCVTLKKIGTGVAALLNRFSYFQSYTEEVMVTIDHFQFDDNLPINGQGALNMRLSVPCEWNCNQPLEPLASREHRNLRIVVTFQPGLETRTSSLQLPLTLKLTAILPESVACVYRKWAVLCPVLTMQIPTPLNCTPRQMTSTPLITGGILNWTDSVQSIAYRMKKMLIQLLMNYLPTWSTSCHRKRPLLLVRGLVVGNKLARMCGRLDHFFISFLVLHSLQDFISIPFSRLKRRTDQFLGALSAFRVLQTQYKRCQVNIANFTWTCLVTCEILNLSTAVK